MNDQIEDWKRVLLDDHRIKHGTDYATARKYGDLRVYCNELFRDEIVEQAEKHGITITSIETWARKPRES